MKISRERNRRSVPAGACLISLTPILTKKKSALTSTFPELFFLRRRDARVPAAAEPRRGDTIRRSPPPRGMIVPLLRSSFSFWASFPHACAWGFLVLCRASGARSRDAQNAGTERADFFLRIRIFDTRRAGTRRIRFPRTKKAFPREQPRRERFSLSEKKKIISFSFR